MTDPIADFLTRIRNAYLVKKTRVEMPYSQTKESLAKILESAGYLEKTEVKKSQPHKVLRLTLHYVNKLPALSGLERLSKPGRRLYIRANSIRPVLSGSGFAIISTSQGLMTSKEARKKGIGGELVCKVW